MTTLSPAQVYGLARGAGFAPATAALMVAIASGESGLRTDARGDVGLQDGVWGPSIGLWQIRSLKAATGTGAPRDASRLTDPAFNAASAFSIYKGQGLNAWTVYSSGAYKKFMGTAAAAAGTGGAPVPPSSATPAPAGGSTTQEVGLGPLTGWNPFAWGQQLTGAIGETAAGTIWNQAKPAAIYAMFTIFGLAMVGTGITVTVWPTTSKAAGYLT